MEEKLMKLLNNGDLLHHLVYLYERWQDEWRYEDFKDYEEAMRKRLPVIEGMAFLKANKRPFGFYISLEGKKHLVFIKHHRRGYWSMAAKEI